MQEFQATGHPQDHDYLAGSPHLKHASLHEWLLTEFKSALVVAATKARQVHILDVGAGDGAFVGPGLAQGCLVTATEMSQGAAKTLKDRFGANPNFDVVVDTEGDLSCLGAREFNVILYASVLHHIPDYLGAIDSAITQHLESGGSFISFQDPMLYADVSRPTYLFSKIAYFSWRLGQGNYKRGLYSLIRRFRGVYDGNNIADMVEFHVVRSGVDQKAIMTTINPRFASVTLLPYWSTQSGIWQRLGDRLHLQNTFAIIASGYKISN